MLLNLQKENRDDLAAVRSLIWPKLLLFTRQRVCSCFIVPTTDPASKSFAGRPEETESLLLPDFTLRGETSPGVRKREVVGRNLTLTQHHFLWDHSVTSSIKGTVAMPFSQ